MILLTLSLSKGEQPLGLLLLGSVVAIKRRCDDVRRATHHRSTGAHNRGARIHHRAGGVIDHAAGQRKRQTG